MRLFSVFGAGILIGTALCVIIPEGINKLVKNSSAGLRLNQDETSDPHSIVGLTLLFGFVMMLIIDQLSAASNTHYNQISTNESGTLAKDMQYINSNERSNSKMTATIGLIVHSAGDFMHTILNADGIALGAAATTSHTDVEMIVFFAIMLHKAPAAFGLVTFLLHEGLDRNKTRRHLIMFSLSAPIASFITYFGISSSAQETLSEYNATGIIMITILPKLCLGIALLFSAGTFLYVAAVHVLPEITQKRRIKIKELGVLIFGSILPSFLTIKHHHL
ncbi:zinc transporter ZIP9-B-like protein [Sarcoptes scabiei]|uniref:Zinc transporter ZIP9-B-like protein n=1 Tax=Sarcoptes scabiei TaxID=52283 RepID=A0A132AEX9_SARSC|nr:zinc transporter ZIP9-B-like protein [Sarcoptes scabiei]